MAPAATAGDPAPVGITGRRNAQTYGVPTQRDRLVAAMGELTAELGLAAVGVHHVCQRAGVSRRTFYDLYADRDACVIDMHEEAFGRLLGHLAEAVADAGAAWEDRAVALTQALLGAWDADRVLAQLCLVSSVSGHTEALELRRVAMAQIAGLLADPPRQPMVEATVLACAISGVWGLAFAQLTEKPDTSISDLAGVAIFLLLAPFAGRRHAAARAAGRGGTAAYVTRWTPTVVGGDDDRGLLVTELTSQTLRYLNGHPGAANIDIARAVDVRHESQMSRHLGRLEKAGMVSRRKEGRTNAWVLTARGEEAARTLRDLRRDTPRLADGAWASSGRNEA
jgi:AcrR family transcriptional regulator/DNA-binding MarR family transcriptional regulator